MYQYNGINNEEIKALMRGEITLYHGSDHVIKTPVFGFGNMRNDYGVGFYCTRHLELAQEWAVGPDRDGYVNSYHLDSKGLRTLDLNGKNTCILHWVTLLLRNRGVSASSPTEVAAMEYLLKHFSINIDGYDIIVGYRADDSYFAFARDFLRNTLSLERLSYAMKLGNLGSQVVLKSKRAFERLRFLGSDPVSQKAFYPIKEKRDLLARSAYRDARDGAFSPNETFILDIIRKGITADDPSL